MHRVIFFLLCLLVPLSASAREPFKISINVVTSNPRYTPPFEECIKREILTVVKLSGVPVQFAPYADSTLDVFLVTQPAITREGEQRGVAAAIVVDSRILSMVPEIYAVSAGTTSADMTFICTSVGQAFRQYLSRSNQAPEAREHQPQNELRF